MINSLDAASVASLKAGQVIVEPSSIVKELVENAIDAGATAITVKIVDHGLTSVTVVDNGHGIDPSDFELVAAAHTTSKLAAFGDLEKVETLGFRGEALASICALACLEIVTSTGDIGSKLEFNAHGALSGCTQQPAARGTSAQVSDLFRLFPVRRKDYERNHKKKYMEIVRSVQAYALIWTGTLVIEHTVNNKKSTVLRAQGADLSDRIALIYGHKVASSLARVDCTFHGRTLRGCISSPSALGKAGNRSNTHMFYINGRPTDQRQIHKTIATVFQEFEPHAVPFYVLNLVVPPNELDVNITPDKRDIRLVHMYHVLQQIGDALRSVFSDREGEELALQRPLQPSQTQQMPSSLLQFMGTGPMRTQCGVERDEEDSSEVASPASPPPKRQRPLSTGSTRSLDFSQFSRGSSEASAADTTFEVPLSKGADSLRLPSENELEGELGAVEHQEELEEHEEEEPADLAEHSGGSSLFVNAAGQELDLEEPLPLSIEPDEPVDLVQPEVEQEPEQEAGLDLQEYEPEEEEEDGAEQQGEEEEEPTHTHSQSHPPLQSSPTPTRSTFAIPSLTRVRKPAQHISLPTTIDSVRQAVRSMADAAPANAIKNYAIDEDSASERLNLIIRKSDFANMRIIGQFNLGFILVSMPSASTSQRNIFIVDQHASDEIYNFERLQRETIIRRQPLVVPRRLELSAVEELVLINNIEVFEQNGFSIKVDPEQKPGQQCFLTALPFSKGTVFGDSDVRELIYKVQDHSIDAATVKCSKLRAMFAMRACRSSIMVGHPLRENAMRKVVDNLGTLNKPWNCPHGRPTIRHITSLY